MSVSESAIVPLTNIGLVTLVSSCDIILSIGAQILFGRLAKIGEEVSDKGIRIEDNFFNKDIS
ncbi:hypothetical protein AN643_03330 [Candidatus Epulonipiscioides saccharophilum]|nr:hypothetical protein AN643_03330 [Epulopiscium sp. SCG-B10WGA-EpuloB]